MIHAMYVNEGLLISDDPKLSAELLNHLKEHFKMNVNKFLGFEIKKISE